ncbi:MAG: hypothetical protein VB997_00500, partial [Opitutales bacterium]
GAIYVVDWYNPITCHQDDFYRHPGRDKTHGRIWRIAPKGGVLPIPKLAKASVPELLDALLSHQRWTRLKAKQVLAERKPREVLSRLSKWASTGERVFQAVMLLEWMDRPDETLLSKLLDSPDYRERAYAARVAGRWGTRLENLWDLMEVSAADAHPRPRMETVLACGQVPDPRSALVAATVAEYPRDRWIGYAFSQAVHHLRPMWLPAFRRGEIDFSGRRGGLAALLGQSESRALPAEIRKLLKSKDLKAYARINLLKTLISVGEEGDLRLALNHEPMDASILRALGDRERPSFDPLDVLARILKGKEPESRVAVIELVGRWRVVGLRELVAGIASGDTEAELRVAAVKVLGRLGGEESVDVLENIVSGRGGYLGALSVVAMLDIDSVRATTLAAGMLTRSQDREVVHVLFHGFAARPGAGRLLSEALGKAKLGSALGKSLLALWIATGLVDEEISAGLGALAGEANISISYHPEEADELIAAGRKGNRAKGEKLFKSARLGCAACHKVNDEGGRIGPDLTALGGSVPPERILIEVLWPKKQVKEGYSLSRLQLKDGGVRQGYVQGSREGGILLLRDFDGDDLLRVPREKVQKLEEVGSLMPPTARTLSRNDLADLLKYLFELR